MVDRTDFDSETDFQIFLKEAEHRFKSIASGFSADSVRLSLRQEIFNKTQHLQETRNNNNPVYAEKVKQHLEANQDRKEQAIQTSTSKQLSTAEKIRMLQMGKSVSEATQQAVSEPVTTQVFENKRHGFDMAAYKRIANLRARISGS